MGNVRVLTDIQIPQSPRWCRETTSLRTRSRNGRSPGFPVALRGKVRPFFDLVRILSRSWGYDVVVTANPRTAQLYGLFRKIFHLKSPKQIVLELMLDDAKDTLLWRLKQRIQRIAFSRVDLIFVSSRKEIETYTVRLKIPKDRFRFLPFHTNIVTPTMTQGSDPYILSAGKAGRDYGVLAEAIKDLGLKVVVVSDQESVRGIEFPGNAKLLYDIPYSDYYELLRRCRMVAVPLKEVVRSTGQVAILEAMALGKPVVAAAVTGTVDYIQSGVNGILVPPGDPNALREALIKLTHDPGFYHEIASKALESILKEHTFERYTRGILRAVCELQKPFLESNDPGRK